jgi:hypothetical protein
MSIKSDVLELEGIRLELKSLTLKRKKLKEKEKIVESRIAEFLESKNQPGVKHAGTAVLLQKQEKFPSKKPKEQTQASLAVLEKNGIRDAERILKELMDARKKEESIVKQSIKIQKIKNSKI